MCVFCYFCVLGGEVYGLCVLVDLWTLVVQLVQFVWWDAKLV